jgi:thioredoxin 1
MNEPTSQLKTLNSENFESVASSEQGLFLIKFFSPTCGPCATMKPVFELFSTNNENINVYEVDTMESPEIAAHFGVRGVPYTAFCENREVLYSFTGVTPLVDLQYVADNIDDPYFREHGEFQKSEDGKDHTFTIIVILVLLALGAAIALSR